MSPSDYIAIVAVVIALIVPGVHILYGRRREWHDACAFLCGDVSSLLGDIDALVASPDGTNHIAFQYHAMRRLITLELYRKRFSSKRKIIAEAGKIIEERLMELPVDAEYETLLLRGREGRHFQHRQFCEDVRTCILDISRVLIK